MNFRLAGQRMSGVPLVLSLGNLKNWPLCLRGISAKRSGKPCGIGFKDELDLIAHTTEFLEDFLFRAGGVSGIVKPQWYRCTCPGNIGQAWSALPQTVMTVSIFVWRKLIHVLRAMTRDVDADLLHDLYGLGVDVAAGLTPRFGH